MNNLLINNPASHPGPGIYFCKVIRFLPSSNTADIVTVDNNISLLGCNVVCPYPAGFAYGARYFPTHDDQNSEVEFVNSAGDVYCVAAFLENDYNNTAILGFLFPLETTLSIAEYGLYIFRHESDVIWMVRGDGTVQMYHPSGSIIKIGDNDINEVDDSIEQGGLYPAKTDGLYIRGTADYNATKESNLFINWYKGQKLKLDSLGNVIVSTEDSAGTVVTRITMTPVGTVTVETTGTTSVYAGQDATVTAERHIVAVATNGNITAQAQNGDAIVHALNATVDAGNLATLSSDQDIHIHALRNIELLASAGTISVRAPSSSVVVGGVGAGGSQSTNRVISYT